MRASPSRPTVGSWARLFHLLASIWVVGSGARTPSAASRDSDGRRHTTCSHAAGDSIVFDVELIYLARRRGYRMAIVPIRWSDQRGSRMRARPGLAARVAWDLFRIPLIHRHRRAPARERPLTVGTGVLPVLAVVTFILTTGATSPSPRHARLRLPGVRRGRPASARRAAALRHVRRCRRAVRDLPVPAAVRRRVHPVRPAPADRRGVGLDPACRSRWSRAPSPSSRSGRDVRWTVLLLAGIDWPVVYAVKLGQVGPLLLLLVFALGWRWLDRPVIVAASIGRGHADQAPAGPAVRVGRADRPPRVLALGVAMRGRRSSS